MALGIFFYLFRKIPPGQVWETFRQIPLLPFFAFAVFYFGMILWIETWGMAKVISRFVIPVTTRQLIPGRLVSYLVAILNYNAGQAAFAAYLKRTREASFFKTLGALFFMAIIDLYWIIGLAFVGSFFYTQQISGFDFPSWVRRVGYIGIGVLILHLTFWRGWVGRRFGDWLRERQLFQAFHHATLRDYLKAALLRMPLHLFIMGSYWVILRIFQAEISFQKVLATVPAIFLVGAIPITPGGLGAVQAASVELLKNQITLRPTLPADIRPEDLLFAMSLSWMFVNYLIKAIVGAAVLLKTSSTLFKTPLDDENEKPLL